MKHIIKQKKALKMDIVRRETIDCASRLKKLIALTCLLCDFLMFSWSKNSKKNIHTIYQDSFIRKVILLQKKFFFF